MKTYRIVVIIAIVSMIFISSCAKVGYKYKGVMYETPEEVYKEQNKDIAERLDKLQTVENGIGGKATLVIPFPKYLAENFTKHKGPYLSQENKDAVVRFFGQLLTNELCSKGLALEKAKVFDSVKCLSSDDPINTQFTDDYLIIFYKNTNIDKLQWVIKKKSNPTESKIIEDVSAALPADVILNIWLNNVAKTAR